ncbi:MAG: DUF4906 domain-containing protein, partial [Rikenella sp.]|nr:DUF4906 domain-containing protein [Rikenella sp.]
MKIRILCSVLLLALGSCIYDDEPVCCRAAKVTVEMEVCPESMEPATRAVDDALLRDVNLYLYDGQGNIVVHQFRMASRLRFEVRPGDYMLRLVANMGQDMGSGCDLSSWQLNLADDCDVLPMTYEGDISIVFSAAGVVTLPALEMRRAVAKVSCNISVLPEDMELLSAQLLCVPRTSRPFDAAAIPSDADDNYTDMDVLPLDGRQASVEYYMLPNPQGENTAITDQRQKDAANAPAHATYLRLRAHRGDRVLTYAVYLGENTTTNFDVLANRHYRLNISILGDRDIDTRMSAYTVRVWDDFDDYNYGGYCLLDGTRYLHIDVECYDGTAPVRGHLEVLAGDTRSFTFNYGDTGPSHDFDIYDMTGDNEYEMEYYV